MSHYGITIVTQGVYHEDIKIISYKELEKQIEDYFDECYDEFETWSEFIEFIVGDIISDLTHDLDLELCDIEEEMLHDWM